MSKVKRLPEVTVHGRFQPPLHLNHWNYIREGFERADHVTLLITNPFHDEAFDASASWRNEPANNPFTFDERVFMFEEFFKAKGIEPGRYTIKPFNIKDPSAFTDLIPDVPNIVNVYSEWSAKKLDAFSEQGLQVIRLDQPKSIPISGTKLREIINTHDFKNIDFGDTLAAAGLMPEALPGLLQVLYDKNKKVKQ